jgi:hypothetical protein
MQLHNCLHLKDTGKKRSNSKKSEIFFFLMALDFRHFSQHSFIFILSLQIFGAPSGDRTRNLAIMSHER